ncbi:MAG TPA: hypothetical protein VK509_23015 [Polyangiales bacterium]|nr:hypothetical protein [Polyangiales bacterium]
MARGNPKLDALEQMLERGGDDPQRLELVRRAQRFKRSWVELAEALANLRKNRSYERWGYGDLQDYCTKELQIRSATVDKLLLSLNTLQRHAPEVLKRDGVAHDIPSLDSVDYFGRAIGTEEKPGPVRRLDAPDDVIEQLRNAVFDENQSVRELRQRFTPVLRPDRDHDDDGDDAVRKTKAAAQKLIELVPTVSGISEARVGRVMAILEALLRDLEGMLSPAVAARTAGKTLRSRQAPAKKKPKR